jgi:pectate lyase
MKKQLFLFALTLLVPVYLLAQAVTINESAGWLETAYVKWTPFAGATSYNVYYSGMGITDKKIDTQLIRSYGTYYRVDVPGIAAGTYTLKVVPVVNGVENTAATTTTPSLTVKPNVREGYAFVERTILGTAAKAYVPGAYNMDGTPKTGAQIIYISANNANTVTANVINDKKVSVSVTGLMNIISAKDRGYDKTPLIIRMLGKIKNSDITGLVGTNYVAFNGANSTDRLIENITFEGIGDDATAYGFSFFTKRSRSIEIRNVGLMLWGGGKDGDGVSMEADNFNIWVHNCDFFYGASGSDADQVKGDGSIDMKYNTTNITISYNHFWDSGKTTFAGGADEVINSIFFTYHHNWFDHTDSRNARICWGTVHMYNNYMDANATMDLLNTEAASVFMEANKFRKCPYPMMINMQGTNYEKWPSGTQNGGMTKAYNNAINMAEVTKLLYQTDRPTDFDAYLVNARNETIPETVKSRKGSNIYNNFDTDVSMYSYTPLNPNEVAADVTANAGRMNGGDFKWTFNNAIDDNLTTVNAALKTAITNYNSSLVGIQGIDNLLNALKSTFAVNVSTYPNPVINVLKIDCDETIESVEVVNLNGESIFVQSGDCRVVNMSCFDSGSYILRVKTQKNITNKIIIKI